MILYILLGLIVFISPSMVFAYSGNSDSNIIRVGFFGDGNYNEEESACNKKIINHMKRLDASFVLGTLIGIETITGRNTGFSGIGEIEKSWFNNVTDAGDLSINGFFSQYPIVKIEKLIIMNGDDPHPKEIKGKNGITYEIKWDMTKFELNKKHLFFVIEEIPDSKDAWNYGYPPFFIVNEVPYKDAINDIVLLDDPKCQEEIMKIQELRKKLEYGKLVATEFMKGGIVGLTTVDEPSMTLIVGFIPASDENILETQQAILDKIGYDIPIKFGGGVSYAEESKTSNIESPRKQMQNGILPNDVTCRDGKTLFIKSSGGALCLTESTAKKMMQRGLGALA